MCYLAASPETETAATALKFRPRILVSDDQHDILTALDLMLRMHGYRIEAVDSPEAALRAADSSFDLILIDLNYSRDTTSGEEGLKLLRGLRKKLANVPIVVMTAWGNVELAVEAMRHGASDFVQKPWDNSRLLETVRKELERAAAARRAAQNAKSEFEIARHVQQNLFPQKRKPLETLEYAGRCVPARLVGGDYYDFFDYADGRLAGVLADVSGKGVGAAMLMANLQASFRSQYEGGVRDTRDVLHSVNRLFFEATPPEQYVTLFYFDYDERSRTLSYANCGHPPPLMMRASGVEEYAEPTSTVVGLFAKWECTTKTTTLDPGDRLFAFTDGATDCVGGNGVGEELGDEGFIDLLRRIPAGGAEESVEWLQRELKDFGGDRDLVDDQTVLALVSR
jgi:phosphoserine phosphatase RsbU/P